MNISREELNRAIKGGNLKWSDIAPASSVSGISPARRQAYEDLYKNEEIAREKQQAIKDSKNKPAANVGLSGLPEEPESTNVPVENKVPKKAPISGVLAPEEQKEYDAADLTLHTYRSFFDGVKNTGKSWMTAKTEREITPFMDLVPSFKNNKDNQDFYALARLYDQKKDDKFYSLPGEVVDGKLIRNKTEGQLAHPDDPFKATVYDSKLDIALNGQTLPQQAADVARGLLPTAEAWAKNPAKILGDIENPIRNIFGDTDQDNRMFPNSSQDVQAANQIARRREFDVAQGRKTIADGVVESINQASGMAVTPMAAAMVLPGVQAHWAGKGLIYGAGAYTGYKTSSAVNEKKGFRKLDDAEVPSNLVEANNKYGDQLVNWSRADGEVAKLLPNLDEVLEGKHIDETSAGKDWENKVVSYLTKEQESNQNVADWFQKIDYIADAPDEDITRAHPDLSSSAESLGASSSMMGTMLVSMGSSFLLNKVSRGLISAGGTRPILDYVVRNSATIASAAANATSAVKSRESEAYSQAAESINKRFSEGISKSLGFDILNKASFTDEQLLGFVNPTKTQGDIKQYETDVVSSNFRTRTLGNYDKAKAEYAASKSISTETRNALLDDIKTGTVATTNDDAVQGAMNYARVGLDEYLRRNMSLVANDIVQNLLVSFPVNAGKVAVANRFDNSLLGSLNRTSNLVAEHVTNSVVGKVASNVRNASIGGVRVGAVPEFFTRLGKKQLISGTEESWLEENPQMAMQLAYEGGTLEDSKNFYESYSNMLNDTKIGGMAIFGLGRDGRYQKDYLKTMAQTYITTGVHTGAMGSFSTIGEMNEVTNKNKAKAFVQGAVIGQLQTSARVNISGVYVDAATKGRDQHVIDYLTELAKNPPEGVDSDLIHDEIRIAKKSMGLANNKTMLAYANRTGGVGSNNHKIAVALAIDHEETGKQEAAKSQTYAQAHEALKSQKFAESDIAAFFEQLNADNESSFFEYKKDKPTKLTEGAQRNIYGALATFKALNSITFSSEETDTASNRKLNHMQGGLSVAQNRSVDALYDALEAADLIDNVDIDNRSAQDLKSRIDAIGIPEIDKDVAGTIGLAHIHAISADYERTMKNRIMGFNKKRDEKETGEAHEYFVDKLVDEYREARAYDEQREADKQEIEDIKRETLEITPAEEIPPVFSSSSKPLGSEAEVAVIEEVPTAPETKVDPIEPSAEDVVEAPSKETVPVVIDSVLSAADSLSTQADDLIAQLKEQTEAIPDPETPETTEENEKAAKSSNEEVIAVVADSSEIMETIDEPDSDMYNTAIEEIPGLASETDIVHDRISRTLFADISNPAVAKFLQDQNAFSNCTIKFVINRADQGKTPWYKMSGSGVEFIGDNNYNINDESTWDNAYVKVLVKYKDGNIEKTVSFSIANPLHRELIKDASGARKFTEDEIAALRDFRRSVLIEEAKRIKDPSLTLRVLNGLKRGLSKLALNRTEDGRATQRGLHEVKGLLDETDPSKIGVANLTLAYGRGERGGNLVVALFESMGITSSENAGGMFITKVDPFDSRNERKIKINKKRVGLDPGAAELIYKLAVDMRGSGARQITINDKGEVIETTDSSPYGLSAITLLSRMVNFGDVTRVKESDGDTSKEFRLKKQFFIVGDTLVYGNNHVNIPTITVAQKQEVMEYIGNHFTWAVSKDDLWNSANNSDNSVADVFPGIAAYFNRNENATSVKIYDGMVFNKEDMGITWTGWLVKNNKLTTDIADGVFEPPFLFLTDVKAVSNNADEIVPIVNGAYTKPVEEVKEAAVKAEEIVLEAGVDFDVAEEDAPLLFDLENFGLPRTMAASTTNEVIDEEAAISFVKSKLGANFNVNILEDAILLADGSYAMGLASNAKIDLFRLAEKGTEFHEVFHIASLLLIPRKRRTAIYENVRNTVPGMNMATDKSVEEYLAEKLRERILSNGVQDNSSLVGRMIRRLYNAYSALRNFNNNDIDRLYSDIERGALRGIKISKRNTAEFKSKYGQSEGAPKRFRDLGLTQVKSEEAKDKFVKGLSYYLFQVSGINGVNDVDKLSYAKLKSSLGKTYKAEIDANGNTPKGMLIKEAYDRFDDYYAGEIKRHIKKLGVTEVEDRDDSNDDGVVSKEMQSHMLSSHEVSKRNNIRTEVKFFISIIPETTYVNNTVVPVRDAVSGIPNFLDFEQAWNMLVYQLGKSKDIDSMKARITELAHVKKDKFFVMVERSLASADDNFLTKFWNTMYSHRNDYVNTVYNANSAAAGSEYARSIRNISSNIDRATRRLPIMWATNLMSEGIIYSQTEDGLVFNQANAEAVSAEYIELTKLVHKGMSVEESNKALSLFGTLLRKLAIDTDEDVMEHIIATTYKSLSRPAAVNAIIKDHKVWAKPFTTILADLIKQKGKKYRVEISSITPKVIYGGELSVATYAEAYAITHPNPSEVIVAGADGANLYEISSRNYVVDVIDKVSEDEAYLDQVLSVPINSGSLVLGQIKDKTSNGIRFGTFVKIYEEGVADQGRDYFDMTTVEDYSMKMSNLLAGNICLPTMADKKSYGFIFGAKLPDMTSKDPSTQRMSWFNSNVSYPSSVIDIFDKYYKSEFEAIKQAWQQVKAANGDKSKLIEGYHYKGPKSKPWAAGHGNGLRFRYCDSLHVEMEHPIGDAYGYVNLNDEIDKMIALQTPIIGEQAAMDMAIGWLDKEFFSMPYADRSKMISSTISDATAAEMEYASSLGLFKIFPSTFTATMDSVDTGVKIGDRVTTYSYHNISLDAAIFAANVEAYKDAGIAKKDVNKVAITNMMANTVINSIISEFECDKLISKDLAFYNNEDDKTKRLSSSLSTGTALRIEFPAGHALAGEVSYNVAQLNDNVIVSTEFSEIEGRSNASQVNKLMIQSGEQAIPGLADMYLDSSRAEELSALKEQFKRQFTLGEAIVGKQLGAYKKVNVTDATAYASPHLYRSLMTRLGLDYFTPEMNEAFEILESDDLSWINDPEKYAKVIDLALQPLKMVYVGDSFQDGLNIPKINKMAIFMLPKFLATGDLANLHAKMNKKASDGSRDKSSIDMAAFSTAVKVGGDKPVNVMEKNGVPSSLEDIKVVPQSFEYLRHQMPTDPHEAHQMTVATQVQKAALGNVVHDKIYENITIGGQQGATGATLAEEWASSLIELSDRGRTAVEKQFGLKLDAQTNSYTHNTKKMYEYLAKEAENSGLSQDVVETIASFDEKNPTAIPIQALADNAFVESKILSNILKKTVDVKTPGGMFIQMTPFGLQHADDSDVAYKLNGGKKLNFLNKDGSMDAVVSINLFSDIIPAELTSYSEKVQWLRDNNIIGENANPAAIGYRIPTQGLSSISGIKFVDVLPEFHGDTIILPQEFTALTGSDFDIDKLYVTRYNYEPSYTYERDEATEASRETEYQAHINNPVWSPRAQKDIVRADITDFDDNRARVEFAAKNGYYYDTNTGMWATVRNTSYVKAEMDDASENKWKTNSAAAIQNRLIDVMMAVITDPGNVDETRIPLDAVTGPVKDALKIIDGSIKKTGIRHAFEKSRLSYENKKKEEYSGGKYGIPTYALAGVHHVLTQLSKLTFKPSKIVNKYKLGHLDAIYSKDGSRILDWLSAMVNAHVDVANDPYIIRMGINKHTHKMNALLLRTGFSDSSFLFLSQPAIKEAVAILNTKGSEYLAGVKNVQQSIIETEVANLIPKYLTAATKLAVSEFDKNQLKNLYSEDSKGRRVVNNGDVFDKNKLVNGLKREKGTFDYYYNQLMVLEAFAELSPMASELADLVKYSQVDTKKAGNSFEAQRLFFDKVNELIANKSSIFANVAEFFNNTFIYRKLMNSAGLAHKLSNGMLFRTTRAVEATADRILIGMGRAKSDNREMISKVNKYIDTKIKSSFFDTYAAQNGVDVPSMFFGLDTMAKRLFAIQQRFPAIIEENYFFKNITPEIYSNKETTRPDQIRPKNNNTSEPGLIEKIKQHFSSALTNENKVIADFARDFIIYQFYSTGDNHASNTIKISEYDRSDLTIKEQDGTTTSYYKFIEGELSRLAESNAEALTMEEIEDIFENRWYDSDMVPNKRYSYSEYDPDAESANGMVTKFMPIMGSTKKINGLDYPLGFFDTKPRKIVYGENPSYLPYVKVQFFPTEDRPFTVLYKLHGTTVTPNGKYTYPLYIAIDRKGTKNEAVSMIEHGDAKSAIAANILPESFTGKKRMTNAAYAWATENYKEFAELYTREVKQDSPFNFEVANTDRHVIRLDGTVSTDVLKEAVINAVDNVIYDGDYTVELLLKELTKSGVTSEEQIAAAKHEFYKAILERSSDIPMVGGITDQTTEDSSLYERVEALNAYSQAVLDETAEYEGYFDVEETNMVDEGVSLVSSSEEKYSRSLAASNPRTLYVFTDNTDRTSGTTPNVGGWYAEKYGAGLSFGTENNPTTAVIRGLDNAYPISTMKWFYRNHKESIADFNAAKWTDADLADFMFTIDNEIAQIKSAFESGRYDNIVIPSGDGFFNSKIADISEARTPKLYEYLNRSWNELEASINDKKTEAEDTSFEDALDRGPIEAAPSEITSRDRIIWAHPGIGKTYAKENGADIIVLDDDYKAEHQELMRLKKEGRPGEYDAALDKYWETAKADVKASGKQLFVSDLPVLKKFWDDFDKVINIPAETFYERAKQRGEFYDKDAVSWKAAIDKVMSKFDPEDILTTDKYLQDMLPNNKAIVSNVSKANIPQNLVSGVESFGTKQYATPEIRAILGDNAHSIDMIEAGLRTRTTRSASEMEKYNVKVGDVVTQFGKSANGTTTSALTRITAIHPKGTPGFLGTWNKEGWTQDGIVAIERYKDGAAAIEFELIDQIKLAVPQMTEVDIQKFNEYKLLAADLDLSQAKLDYLGVKGLTQEQLIDLSPSEENMGMLLKLLC